MRTVFKVVDQINEWVGGKIMHWLCAVLVLVLTFEVTARYVFNSPTMWANQLSIMLLGGIVALGWGYVHYHREHVRVDIFYMNYSPKVKAITDIIGFILLFFPLFLALTYEAWREMVYSYQQHEVMTETYWFPPVGPSRTTLFIGLALILVEGIVQFIRDLYFLIRSKPYDRP
jgi:TRAP-type mannitol/chloroaromatic compound transport system permease small subunit